MMIRLCSWMGYAVLSTEVDIHEHTFIHGYSLRLSLTILHVHSAGSTQTAAYSTALSAKDFTFRRCKHLSLLCLFQRLHSFAQQQLQTGAISEILCPQLHSDLHSSAKDQREETDDAPGGADRVDWFDDLCGPEDEEDGEGEVEVVSERETRQRKIVSRKKKVSVVIREGLSVALVLTSPSSSISASVSGSQDAQSEEVSQEVDELAPLSLHFVY